VLGDTIVTTAGLVIVAWIGYRQEAVRRELKQVNGDVADKLDAIHENLRDNPSSATLRQQWDATRHDEDRASDAPPEL
jgi:hypothetical protein